MVNNKFQLKGLSKEELSVFFEEFGEKKFRGQQVFNWMYNHLADNFEEMENIPKQLRKRLSDECSIKTLEIIDVQNSQSTDTKKYLFRTHDDHKIEAVIIPDKKRSTLCISTQVGCPLDCKFCATGLMGYKRNLSAGEIVDQYILAAKDYRKELITNIVYMGMGEPLLNFETTLKSLSIFTDEENIALSRNRITVSTSGIPGKIKTLADSGLRVKLALSLHSGFEDIRSSIMPINHKYSLHENLEAVKYYAKKTKTRITFEYVMLNSLNDRKEDIDKLTKICRQIPSKINIIPFNSIAHMSPGGLSAELTPTPAESIAWFVERLRNNNLTVMVRDTQGDDIAAACGQLAIKK